VWLGNDDYTAMNESYGGNIPARIWARFMKAALARTPPHDFPFPSDEVAKVAGCGRGYEYYLKGTEPGCGGSIDAYDDPDEETTQPQAASLPQPTLPPPNASPPAVVPPVALPSESALPTAIPSPSALPSAEPRRKRD
jgi:penicillin-binding protein 1A